jgi:hypothetical protein
MGRLWIVIAAIIIFLVAGEAAAQCTREDEDLCQGGQTYRCEKTGGELTPIFQNSPCAAKMTTLTGAWAGSGHQSPAGDAGADWSIAMTIKDDGASIDYPSLGCGGSLSQTSRDDISAEYHESITYGRDKCIDGGNITVRFFKGNLSWLWVGQANGQPYNAVAVLKRQ